MSVCSWSFLVVSWFGCALGQERVKTKEVRRMNEIDEAFMGIIGGLMFVLVTCEAAILGRILGSLR